MKPHPLLIFGILASCAAGVQAQTTIKGHAETSAGYERNIFYNPESYQKDSVLQGKDQLYSNGAVGEVIGKADITHKLNKKNQLDLKLRGNYRMYPSFSRATRGGYFAQGRYRHKISKKVKVGVLGGLSASKYLSQNGAVDDEVRFFRYNNRFVGGEFVYLPTSNDVLRLTAQAGTKKYKVDSTGLNLSNRFRTLELYGQHKFSDQYAITLLAEHDNRKYTNWLVQPGSLDDPEDLEEGEEPEGPTLRHFRVTRGKVAFKIMPEKNQLIAPYVQYRNRKDVGGDLSFHEGRLGLKVDYRANGWGVMANTSYSHRLYTERLARTGNEDTEKRLVYQFVRAEIQPYIPLTDQLRLFASVAYRQRITNSTDVNFRARRGYTNYDIMTGIRYDLDQKFKRKRRYNIKGKRRK